MHLCQTWGGCLTQHVWQNFYRRLALWVNSLHLPSPSRLNSCTQCVLCLLVFCCCSNKDFFKRPFIRQRLKESGVWCYHGDSMALTPETFLLTTSQTTASALTAFHIKHLYKVPHNFRLLKRSRVVSDKKEGH